MVVDSVRYNPNSAVLEIDGWHALKKGEKPKFGVKLDSEIRWATSVIRKEREDVWQALNGGDEVVELDKPGFFCEVPVTAAELFTTRDAEFVMELNGQQETLPLYRDEEAYQEAIEAVLYITIDEKRCVGTYLVIRGWVMSYGKEYNIEVFDDDNKPVDCVIRYEPRRDAHDMFPERVEKNDEVGFVLRVPEERLKRGGITLRFSNQYLNRDRHIVRKDFPARAPYLTRVWEAVRPSTWGDSLYCLRNQGRKAFSQHI